MTAEPKCTCEAAWEAWEAREDTKEAWEEAWEAAREAEKKCPVHGKGVV